MEPTWAPNSFLHRKECYNLFLKQLSSRPLSKAPLTGLKQFPRLKPLSMTAFETETSDDVAHANSPFGQVLNQFYGFTPGGHIAPKKPRGRPPKVQPPPPAGTTKNTISDSDDDELWVDPHDARMIRVEYHEFLEEGRSETSAIEELAGIYNLSYRAVYSVVT